MVVTGQVSDHMIQSCEYSNDVTGYNHATFDDLRYSIPAMLGVQISSGVTLVGADICGYFGVCVCVCVCVFVV